MAHVSNRLKFDTFFTLILSFENGISNERTSLPQKEKKVVSCRTKTLSNDCDMIHSQSQQYINNALQKQLLADFYKIVGVFKGVLKNLTNFSGKHLCRV